MDAKHVTAFNDMLLHDANDILVMNPRLKSLFVASIEKFWFKAWKAFFFQIKCTDFDALFLDA